MNTLLLLAFSVSFTVDGIYKHGTSLMNDAEEIREVISRAYVDGVFRHRDSVLVKNGFHPSFVLSVRTNDGLLVVTLETWLKRLSLDGKPSSKSFEHKFLQVDATGKTAVVKMEIYENGKHKYTDYMGLYCFSEGWRIVNKVFESH